MDNADGQKGCQRNACVWGVIGAQTGFNQVTHIETSALTFQPICDIMCCSTAGPMFYLKCLQILHVTGPSPTQSKSQNCSDLIASKSSEEGISRSGK